MSITHLLEDFTVQSGGGAIHLLDDDALEEQNLAAFEKGYGAGWEDAVQAQEQSQGQISAELGNALQDMSFTYHEAITRMTLSLEPMFQGLTRVVLPDTIERGFATRLVEQLCEMASEQIEQPMQIMVPEGRAGDVEAMIPSDLSPAPRVIEDPSLNSGQARLQVGVSRREVDCGALLGLVAQAFDSYVFEAREALSNE
ncbi:ABC transporter ATP-binding protein [Ruegeria sp. EL01]|jgi:flagellar assembly protein FliH|uniref:ABC transporter ATP-binding protein n=1 Tax=Ruegeria sp. EL01 TaxID=2107578 RepID=UPI000EA82A68|nr:ABC transporter ATP-binding protein [Ruegeria sp. EL01]